MSEAIAGLLLCVIALCSQPLTRHLWLLIDDPKAARSATRDLFLQQRSVSGALNYAANEALYRPDHPNDKK